MLKVGMVGVGCISGIYLKNFFETFKDVKLVAVCDLIRERAEKAKEEWGVEKIYDTMDELFADPEIDIVLNLTRPYQHYDVSKAALLAGKHVYSEKPLGADLAEGEELVRIAAEKGLLIGGFSGGQRDAVRCFGDDRVKSRIRRNGKLRHMTGCALMVIQLHADHIFTRGGERKAQHHAAERHAAVQDPARSGGDGNGISADPAGKGLYCIADRIAALREPEAVGKFHTFRATSRSRI